MAEAASSEPAPETQAPVEETPEPEVTTPEVIETPPEAVPHHEPGSPRRKRQRDTPEPAEPSIVVPRLDASFWQQLVTESRASREALRRERFANLMRF
jgi:hypothetical protein